MDYKFLLLLLFPIIWLMGAKYFLRATFNWAEFGISILVVFCASALFYYTGKYSIDDDTLVLNGKVTNKEVRTQNCPSGWVDSSDSFCSEYRTRQKRVYPDRCSTDSKGHRSCHARYKTQYNYTYPWERRWYVQDTFTKHQMTRVDPQGAKEPNRWTVAYKGEPASDTQDYTNYVKAVPESLFNGTLGATYVTSVPSHPLVFDYYRTNHVIGYKTTAPTQLLQQLNLEIGNILREDGFMYQANIIAVVTDINDPEIRYAFEKAWVGGKKNDIVVFIGRNETNSVVWADVMTWAHNYNNELFQVELRNAILGTQSIDPVLFAGIIHNNIKANYKRPEMKDFEYLKERIQPPTWVLWVVGFICFVFPIGFTFLFHFHDVDLFGEKKDNRKYPY